MKSSIPDIQRKTALNSWVYEENEEDKVLLLDVQSSSQETAA